MPASNSHSERSDTCHCAGMAAWPAPVCAGDSLPIRTHGAANKSRRLLAKLTAIPKNTQPVPDEDATLQSSLRKPCRRSGIEHSRDGQLPHQGLDALLTDETDEGQTCR